MGKNNDRLIISALEVLPDFDGITFCDIGAAGGLPRRWERIKKYINYIGFEPDGVAASELQRLLIGCKTIQIYPHALYSKDALIDFYFCKKSETSSIRKPNFTFLNRYPLSDRFDIIHKTKLNAKSLDSLDVQVIDFIKLDVQGGELEVLKGATKTLRNVVGVESEVEFLEMYVEQPLFGDIALFLKQNDFEFYDFTSLIRWGRDCHSHHGQCIFGDGLFLKDPEGFSQAGTTLKEISTYFAVLIIFGKIDVVKSILLSLPPDAQASFHELQLRLRYFEKARRKIEVLFRICNLIMNRFGGGKQFFLMD